MEGGEHRRAPAGVGEEQRRVRAVVVDDVVVRGLQVSSQLGERMRLGLPGARRVLVVARVLLVPGPVDAGELEGGAVPVRAACGEQIDLDPGGRQAYDEPVDEHLETTPERRGDRQARRPHDRDPHGVAVRGAGTRAAAVAAVPGAGDPGPAVGTGAGVAALSAGSEGAAPAGTSAAGRPV